MATKNLYASLFGESPETQQARQTRDLTFQDMLNSRRQVAQQNYTDAAKMAKYNALGNVLTTMVQPIGWAAGGSTAGVQKYDDRQYIDAFNRALKAQDDLRNIGNAEAEYNFKLAEQDYNRLQSLEDAERQQQRIIERQELAEQGRMERDQKQFENKLRLQQEEADARIQGEQCRKKNKVTSRKTGLDVGEKALLEQIKAYNTQVAKQAYDGTIDQWLTERGFKIDKISPVIRSSRPAGGGGGGGSVATENAGLVKR